jgi:GT2 family glycosyltransferase
VAALNVGLVIVTFDTAALISRCLASLAAQTRRPDRVVLVDNASTDGTLDAARLAAAESRLSIEVIAQERNVGFARANNVGVAALHDCDWVALLNPDAFPEPGWLAALLAAVERHPEAASFASRLMRHGVPGVLDGAGDVYHVSGLVWRHGSGRPLADIPEAQVERPVFAACAAAALYSRRDWNEVNGMDERYFCYVEDVDLGFRLQLAGRSCWYVPDAVATHVGSASAGVGSTFSVYHGHRNLVRTFVKDMPAPLVWRYLPLHLLSTVVAVVWFTLRGRGTAILRAKWDAVAYLGDALATRRTTQARRLLPVADLMARLDRSSLVARWFALVRSRR